MNDEEETRGKVEIIFITDDRTNDAFDRNFLKMPWLSIPYTQEHRIESLKSRFGIV